ncbi:MAG: hypothetical protein BZ138_07360, partial [Methanosphaera sp. rholeuAM270]
MEGLEMRGAASRFLIEGEAEVYTLGQLVRELNVRLANAGSHRVLDGVEAGEYPAFSEALAEVCEITSDIMSVRSKAPDDTDEAAAVWLSFPGGTSCTAEVIELDADGCSKLSKLVSGEIGEDVGIISMSAGLQAAVEELDDMLRAVAAGDELLSSAEAGFEKSIPSDAEAGAEAQDTAAAVPADPAGL